MRLPPLWGFQGLSLLYLPSPEQGNVLCLHLCQVQKRAWQLKIQKNLFLLLGQKKKNASLLLVEFSGCSACFWEFFKERLRMCFFPIFVHIFGVSHNWIIFPNFFSEPNVCCKTTETSVLSKVKSMRLPENTYFFPRERQSQFFTTIATFFTSQNVKRLGMAADLSTELEIVETQKSVFETMISSVSIVLFGWEFM